MQIKMYSIRIKMPTMPNMGFQLQSSQQLKIVVKLTHLINRVKHRQVVVLHNVRIQNQKIKSIRYLFVRTLHAMPYMFYACFTSFGARYLPVYILYILPSSGLPQKTTHPPSSPPSGPRSITQSELFITS